LSVVFLSAKLYRLDRQQSGTSGEILPVLFKRRASVSELCRRRTPYSQSEMKENKSVVQTLQV